MEGLSGLPLAADPAELSLAATAPACSIVIFGAAGDLTRRLLMPAIYNLRVAGLLPDSFRVIGVDRVDEPDEAFRDRLGETMQHFVAERAKKRVPSSTMQPGSGCAAASATRRATSTTRRRMSG